MMVIVNLYSPQAKTQVDDGDCQLVEPLKTQVDDGHCQFVEPPKTQFDDDGCQILEPPGKDTGLW